MVFAILNILIFNTQGDAGSSAAGIKVKLTPEFYWSFGCDYYLKFGSFACLFITLTTILLMSSFALWFHSVLQGEPGEPGRGGQKVKQH